MKNISLSIKPLVSNLFYNNDKNNGSKLTFGIANND